MSTGQSGADKTKSTIGSIGQAGEDLRHNVNSFADNLLGGNKQHGGTGFSKDANKTGEKFAEGVNTAGQKMDERKEQKHSL